MATATKPKAVKRKQNTSLKSGKKMKLPESLMNLMDMNDDCLIHLFKFLDIISLARMSKADDRCHYLILKHIIPTRTIDFSTFSKLRSVRKLFALFGTSMARIVVKEDDIQMVEPGYSRFAEFLRMVMKYGEPGVLKEVHLQFDRWWQLPANLLTDIVPYFVNVHTLKFESATASLMSSRELSGFLNAIDKTNLRSLTVKNVRKLESWLTPESLANLKSINLKLAFYPHQFYRDRVDAQNER